MGLGYVSCAALLQLWMVLCVLVPLPASWLVVVLLCLNKYDSCSLSPVSVSDIGVCLSLFVFVVCAFGGCGCVLR